MADMLFGLLFAAVVKRAKLKDSAAVPIRIPWDGQRSLQALDSTQPLPTTTALEEVVYADDLAAFTMTSSGFQQTACEVAHPYGGWGICADGCGFQVQASWFDHALLWFDPGGHCAATEPC